jgi:hypothetical protein
MDPHHSVLLVLFTLLILIISNIALYFYSIEPKSIETYTSYSELSTAIGSDPSFQLMVATSYNDPSYQHVLKSANLEIYDIIKPYSPVYDPHTQYKTDNYMVEYHDTFDISDNYLEGSDIFKVGYQTNGSFRYGSRSFVPNYEEAILLSSVLKVYQGQDHPLQLSAEYTLPLPLDLP